MKKSILFIGVLMLVVSSCSNYSKEQGDAAQAMCDCMSKDEADKDMLYFMCEEELNQNFDKTIFADEGYAAALKEKCPDNEVLVSE